MVAGWQIFIQECFCCQKHLHKKTVSKFCVSNMHFRLYLSNGMNDHFEIIVALSKETSVLADVMFKMQDVPSFHSVGHIFVDYQVWGYMGPSPELLQS